MDKEPQIGDFYKEYPSCYYVIEKLHQEYEELIKENEELRKENEILKKKQKHFDYIISFFSKLPISKQSKFSWIYNE